MADKVVPYIGDTYRYPDRDISSQDAVNIEPFKTSGTGAKTQRFLKRTSGILPFSNLTSIVDENRPIRGLIGVDSGDLYVCVGDSLILVNSLGEPTKVMDITDGVGQVSMAELSGSLFVCDGTTIWGYKYSTGTKAVAGLPFNTPLKIVTYGKRLVAINADQTIDVVTNQSKVYWSELSNGYVWSDSAWSEAEGRDDALIGLELVQGGLLLQGKNSIETWVISSDPYSPFVRSSVIPYGGVYSTVNSCTTPTGTAYWISSSNDYNNVIVRSSGGGFEMASNDALNAELATYSTTKDARVWSYTEAGQTYVIFTFLAADISFVYNETQGSWHRRTSRDPLTNATHHYTPLFAAQCYDKVIVGSINGAYLMVLDDETYTEWDYRYDVDEDNAKPILVEYSSPVYWTGKKYVMHHSFELDIDTGNAPLSGPGSDPKIMMTFDDGNGPSKIRVKKIGKRGKYNQRVRWTFLGGAIERVYRITFTDRCPLTILNAVLDTDIGRY